MKVKMLTFGNTRRVVVVLSVLAAVGLAVAPAQALAGPLLRGGDMQEVAR